MYPINSSDIETQTLVEERLLTLEKKIKNGINLIRDAHAELSSCNFIIASPGLQVKIQGESKDIECTLELADTLKILNAAICNLENIAIKINCHADAT